MKFDGLKVGDRVRLREATVTCPTTLDSADLVCLQVDGEPEGSETLVFRDAIEAIIPPPIEAGQIAVWNDGTGGDWRVTVLAVADGEAWVRHEGERFTVAIADLRHPD